MNRTRAFLIKALLFVFALNTIFLPLYIFRTHPPHTENRQSLTEKHKSLTENHKSSHLHLPYHGKPWSILPSFLPWSLNPNLSPGSCEAYFGNGFSRRIDLLPESSKTLPRSSGWFRCFYSETLESSICEGGGIRMNPGRIRMSIGGESLSSVIGRQEEEELPSFEPGSFEIVNDGGIDRVSGQKVVNQEFLDKFVPLGAVQTHTMRSLLDSMRFVDRHQFECSQWIEDPTLLVTRFEYANLFHTITDWYSAYVSSRVTGLPNRPHLIFVDGHCKASMEETWGALFSSLRYAKHFTGPVCFRHVVLTPLGYETALFKGLTQTINCDGAPAHDLWLNPNDQKTARLSEFGEMLRAAFNLRIIKNKVVKPLSSLKVLFVRREDYLAHPRHNGRVESRLSDEQEVFDALKNWATNHMKCKVNLVNGLFAHMNMKEQIRLIQDASVIIGAHGAGLTHIVSATPDTVVLEIISSQYRRPHFALISKWRGLEYHAINLAGSHAEPAAVISKLSDILGTLGC